MLPAPIVALDDRPFLVGGHWQRRVPAALVAIGAVAQMFKRVLILQRPPEFTVEAAQ
jgi:hypothetical protein